MAKGTTIATIQRYVWQNAKTGTYAERFKGRNKVIETNYLPDALMFKPEEGFLLPEIMKANGYIRVDIEIVYSSKQIQPKLN